MQHLRIGHDAVKSAVTFREMRRHAVLRLPLPNSLLRLQRREYFRLETPHASPLHCKLVRRREDGSSLIFNLALLDISGGWAQSDGQYNTIRTLFSWQHFSGLPA